MSLLRSGAYTLASSIGQIVLGIAAVTILAKSLGPAGKGVYDLYWTTANMAVMVFGLALPAGVTYTVARGQIQLSRLLTQLIALSIAIGGLTLIVTRVFATARFGSLLPNDSFVLKTAGMTAAGLAALNLFRAVIVGQRSFGKA